MVPNEMHPDQFVQMVQELNDSVATICQEYGVKGWTSHLLFYSAKKPTSVTSVGLIIGVIYTKEMRVTASVQAVSAGVSVMSGTTAKVATG